MLLRSWRRFWEVHTDPSDLRACFLIRSQVSQKLNLTIYFFILVFFALPRPVLFLIYFSPNRGSSPKKYIISLVSTVIPQEKKTLLKALIFDMDGVLVDSMPYHAAAWKKTFLDFGMEIRAEDVYAIEGSNPKNGLHILIRKSKKDPDAFDFEEITERYRQEFKQNFKLKAFEGMKEGLEVLKERFLLSVVSGSDCLIVHGILDELFPGLFDVVVTGDDVLRSKPFPDPYLQAVKLLSVKKEECTVIENAILGVEAAKRAGLYCIGIPTYLECKDLDHADLIVEDHEKLLQYLLNLEYCPIKR